MLIPSYQTDLIPKQYFAVHVMVYDRYCLLWVVGSRSLKKKKPSSQDDVCNALH